MFDLLKRAVTMTSRKREFLTLNEKVEILKTRDNESLRCRQLGDRFNILKTQAADIVREKEKILKQWDC